MLGNVLMSIAATCTFISYLPQAIKLLKTKSSEDISVLSWILWVISNICYTFYAIVISQDIKLVLATFLELFFCLMILSLSVYYSNNKKLTVNLAK